MEELQFDSIIFQSRSLIDKYEISFNSTSCPIPAPIDLHTKASNYTLLEIVPPDNSHSDWLVFTLPIICHRHQYVVLICDT